MVVAREVDMGDKLIIFDQPTRGLDLGAINYVHKTILGERDKGKCGSSCLNRTLRDLCTLRQDAVLYKGKIQGIFKNGELTTEKIGLLMAGVQPEKEGAES